MRSLTLRRIETTKFSEIQWKNPHLKTMPNGWQILHFFCPQYNENLFIRWTQWTRQAWGYHQMCKLLSAVHSTNYWNALSCAILLSFILKSNHIMRELIAFFPNFVEYKKNRRVKWRCFQFYLKIDSQEGYSYSATANHDFKFEKKLNLKLNLKSKDEYMVK